MTSTPPKVVFKRREPRRWLGNGFGHKPASYDVIVDGKDVGRISSAGDGHQWKCWFHAPFPSFYRDHLTDLKVDVKKYLEGRNLP